MNPQIIEKYRVDLCATTYFNLALIKYFTANYFVGNPLAHTISKYVQDDLPTAELHQRSNGYGKLVLKVLLTSGVGERDDDFDWLVVVLVVLDYRNIDVVMMLQHSGTERRSVTFVVVFSAEIAVETV